LGVFERVAKRLDVDASFVSRVAAGTRKNEAVYDALIKELSSIRLGYRLVLVGAYPTPKI
jgi:ribosomal protein L20